MKQFFTLLIALALLTGCSKKEEALNPDFTAGLTGVYALTYYSQGSFSVNLPSSGSSGQFDITKVDLTHIHVKLTLTYSPGDVHPNDVGDAELKRDPANSSMYTMYLNSRNVGTITASNINVNDTSSDGTVTAIKAKR